jgi:hypothetical protein
MPFSSSVRGDFLSAGQDRATPSQTKQKTAAQPFHTSRNLRKSKELRYFERSGNSARLATDVRLLIHYDGRARPFAKNQSGPGHDAADREAYNIRR